MAVRRRHILSLRLLFHLLSVSVCAEKTVHGIVGRDVVLPCRYDATVHGKLHSCWGRGPVPNSGCSNELISSDGTRVTRRKSERYQLRGGLEQGDVSLTITGVQEADAGRYGCRVHVIGLFNDQKETVKLVITRAPVPTGKAPELRTEPATEQASKTMWTTLSHTHGPEATNSTGSSEASVAQNADEGQSVKLLAALLPALLLLLLALVIVFVILMRKRWKKAGEMLGISQQPTTGIHYRNSESSLGLSSREMAVENIYQMDEEEGY